MRGGNCQNSWINCQVGRMVSLVGREATAVYRVFHPPRQYIQMLQRAQMHMHTQTVEHSKINTVRATMIPLHYLHTGPPSCTCLPHCPLHCFSMEVVITKANISCSLCLQLPSTCPLFISLFAVRSSVLPVFTNWWHSSRYVSVDGSTCVTQCVYVWELYYEITWCPADVQ